MTDASWEDFIHQNGWKHTLIVTTRYTTICSIGSYQGRIWIDKIGDRQNLEENLEKSAQNKGNQAKLGRKWGKSI